MEFLRGQYLQLAEVQAQLGGTPTTATDADSSATPWLGAVVRPVSELLTRASRRLWRGECHRQYCARLRAVSSAQSNKTELLSKLIKLYMLSTRLESQFEPLCKVYGLRTPTYFQAFRVGGGYGAGEPPMCRRNKQQRQQQQRGGRDVGSDLGAWDMAPRGLTTHRRPDRPDSL